MLASGVTLTSVLETLSRGSSDEAFAEVAQILGDELERGAPLSQAMALFPRVFPRAVLAMMAAGEKSGKLVETMKLAGDWLELRRDIRARLKAALTYPVFVLLFAIVGGMGITIFLLPELLDAIRDLGAELHWTTRLLIASGNLVRDPSAWMVFVALLGLVIQKGSNYLESPAGRVRAAVVLRQFPLIGPTYQALGLTDFLDTLGCMLKAGTDLLGALTLSFAASGDAALAATGPGVRERIEEGDALHVAMGGFPEIFPKGVVSLIAVGEESGQLEGSVESLARFYRQEAEHRIGLLTVALEPLLLGAMSLVVAFCAVAFLMPLQSLLASLS